MVRLTYFQPLEKWYTDPVKSTVIVMLILCVLCLCAAAAALAQALRRPKADLYQMPDLKAALERMPEHDIPDTDPLLSAYTGKRIYGWTRGRTACVVLSLVISIYSGYTGYRDAIALQLWRKADTASHRKNYALAADLNAQALAKIPGSRVAHTRLAQSLIDLNRPKEALAHLEVASRGEVIDATPWMLLGDCLMFLDRAADAEKSYREAQRIAPHNPEINVLAGHALVRQRKIEQAEQEYLFAVRTDHEYARALAGLGNLQSATGRLDEGLQNLKHAVRNAPSDPLIRDGLAMAYARMGNHDLAAAEFRAEIAIDPDRAVPYFNLGHALEALGDYLAALDAYQAFIRKCTDRPGPQVIGVPQAYAACNRIKSRLYHIKLTN
jgi:tetratricopeptide (TPR) repeat protein